MTLVHCRGGHGGQGPPQYGGHRRWCGLGAPPTATPTPRLVVLVVALPGLAGGPVLPGPLPRHIRLLAHGEGPPEAPAHAAPAARPVRAVLVDDGGGGDLGPGGVGRQHRRGRHDEGVSQHHGELALTNTG